jgi:class 3 adenylate cyclase/tetratricopeptide (TPR) repeat protein
VLARKTVTVLFCDVADSTPLGEQLDPESLQRVMSRWFEQARAVIEHHGGTVEKFIGDEVMAVFGVPVVHEDDALRAVRAAAELRRLLARLNEEFERDFGVRIAVRMGINTGEVVAGDPASGATFVTGEPVILAKRLEQAAGPDEILIGRATYPLVRDAVRAGPLESFPVKGKRDPVAPWRIDRVDAEAAGVARRLDAPLVGRREELERLRAVYDRAVAERACALVTVLGTAGIGKSRLAQELSAQLAGSARVLSGKCLPYGNGITFWPLVDIVGGLGGDEGLGALLEAIDDGHLVAERVRAALGTAEAAPTDELFWAVRRLVETLARERPLVLLLEDIHWAEPTFLDLVEYVHGWTHGVPVLLLCLARPDLLERRPGWPGQRERTETLALEPLSEDDAEALLGDLGVALDPTERARVLASAEGNPLYVEQMAALSESGELVVPPTIQALLAERLDRLHPEERSILERASIVGREFTRRQVTDLCPPELRPHVGRHLLALVRKELIRPELEGAPREDTFRFRHGLIRDAAYEGMPKEARSLFHEWFADWMERHAGERLPEREEIVGYHLEQAAQLRAQLGPVDDRLRVLAARAANRLEVTGRRARLRGDLPAAVNLLERAAALRDEDDPARIDVGVELGATLRDGGLLARAAAVLDASIASAGRLDDERLHARAQLERAIVRMYTEPAEALPRLEEIAGAAVEVFERHADHDGLSRAWRVVAGGRFGRGRFASTAEALELAGEHARRAGDEREELLVLPRLAVALSLGPVASDEALERCEEILRRVRDHRVGAAVVRAVVARLRAMRREFDDAQAEYERAQHALAELGNALYSAALPLYAGPVQYYSGDLDGAEREVRAAYAGLNAIGEKAALSTSAALLARIRLEQGDAQEAEALIATSEEAASADDVFTRTLSCGARARILALRGDDGALLLARETVGLAERTDSPSLQGDALVDQALVLRSLGDGEGAALDKLGEARARFEVKRDLASLARVDGLTAEQALLDAGLTKS